MTQFTMKNQFVNLLAISW